MTLPQVNALAAFWQTVPPPAAQLRRIALYLGLPDPRPGAPPSSLTPEEAMREAMAAGLPVMRGRPDDPILDLVGL